MSKDYALVRNDNRVDVDGGMVELLLDVELHLLVWSKEFRDVLWWRTHGLNIMQVEDKKYLFFLFCSIKPSRPL